jgi:hypothetical protein
MSVAIHKWAIWLGDSRLSGDVDKSTMRQTFVENGNGEYMPRKQSPFLLTSTRQARRTPVTDHARHQDLLGTIEEALRNDSNVAYAFAALLCHIRELIENGPEDMAHARRVLDKGIEYAFAHTNEYKVALDRYRRYLKGELTPGEESLSFAGVEMLNGQVRIGGGAGKSQERATGGQRSGAEGQRLRR